MKKNMRRTALIFTAAAAASLVFTACGGSSRKTEPSYNAKNYVVAETAAAAAAPAAAPQMMDYAAEEAAYDGGYGAADMTAGSGVTGGVSGVSAAAAASLKESGADGGAEVPKSYGKLIRTAGVSMETMHFDALTASIREKTAALGGYIESSNEYSRYDDKRNCFMLIRIPQDRLDEFLNTALTEGTVVSRSENVEDVTLAYSDIETRVATLKVEQERLLDLLKRAEDVESIIAIESRLSEISYEIENNASRLRIYDNKISYSTVTVDITEVDATASTVEAGLWEKIGQGIEQNLADVASFFGALLFAIVIHIPGLIAFAVFAALIFFLVRFIIRKLRARKEKKQEKP